MGHDYPASREADVVLKDGSTVHLRPVRSEDEPALLELFEGLGGDSRMFRFFSAASDLAAAAKQLADVDYEQRYGLVATSCRARGWGRSCSPPPRSRKRVGGWA